MKAFISENLNFSSKDPFIWPNNGQDSLDAISYAETVPATESQLTEAETTVGLWWLMVWGDRPPQHIWHCRSGICLCKSYGSNTQYFYSCTPTLDLFLISISLFNTEHPLVGRLPHLLTAPWTRWISSKQLILRYLCLGTLSAHLKYYARHSRYLDVSEFQVSIWCATPTTFVCMISV